MASVLVTGMSGTGKSTALDELGRRGFRVVDTDGPGWSEWVPATSEWLWREDRIAELLASEEDGVLYVSGCMSNQGKFYDRFDAVVLLSAPLEVILERVANRTTNDYGKGPGELDLIRFHLETVEPLLRATSTHELDASKPLDDVVDELVTIGRERRGLTGALVRMRVRARREQGEQDDGDEVAERRLRPLDFGGPGEPGGLDEEDDGGDHDLAEPPDHEEQRREHDAPETQLGETNGRREVEHVPGEPEDHRPDQEHDEERDERNGEPARDQCADPEQAQGPIHARVHEASLRHRNVDLAPARSSCSGKADIQRREGTTMKYLLLVCWDAEQMDAQTEPGPDETPKEEGFPWLDDLQARGRWITGDQLAPPRRARSVRVRDGKTIVTDGPFVETKEAVGGFDIVECDSLEEAVEVAAGHPIAQMGTIEVRPLWGK